MAKLVIENIHSSNSMNTMRISNFNNGELNELKSMEHNEASEKLLEMLDTRNGNIGTCWHNGNGVYGIWFDNEFAYVNIGKSCD